MAPRVSICLPVYNGERYLAEAIESVLRQTENDWELIICDDGSADGSLELAKSYSSRDTRIRLRQNPTRLGLFSNYNACMELATGEFIKLFAQDDLLHPELLQQCLLAAVANSDAALIAVAKHWVNNQGEVVEVIQQFDKETKVSSEDVMFENLSQFTNWVGEPSCVMFPRRNVGTGFDTDFYHSGDIEFWFRILRNGPLYYLPDVLCSFRRHSASESSYNLRSLRFVCDFMRLGEKYRDVLAKRGLSDKEYLKSAVSAASRVVFSLVDDEDIEAADTSRFAELDEAKAKENLAYISKVCFEVMYQLVLEAEKSAAIRADLSQELYAAEERLSSMTNSLSWRVTKPIRAAKRKLKSS